MNGIHDMGGMHGFGPVVRESDEPVFHSAWERRVFALAIAMMASGAFNIDEFRRTIEHMPPLQYLGADYYERWSGACERLLIEKGILSSVELDVVTEAFRLVPQTPVSADGERRRATAEPEEGQHSINLGGHRSPLRYDQSFQPRFKVGDAVIARNLNPIGHTRMPRYVRGRRGIIHRDWGVFVFPDTHAHGLGAKRQHCFAVQFEAKELWGDSSPAGDRVYVDLREDYLDLDVRPVVIDVQPHANGSPEAASTQPPNSHAGKQARKRAARRNRGSKTPHPETSDEGIRQE